MGILSKIENVAPSKTRRTVCLTFPIDELDKFDALAEAHHLNRSKFMTLAMKTFREQVEAEKKGLVAA